MKPLENRNTRCAPWEIHSPRRARQYGGALLDRATPPSASILRRVRVRRGAGCVPIRQTYGLGDTPIGTLRTKAMVGQERTKAKLGGSLWGSFITNSEPLAQMAADACRFFHVRSRHAMNCYPAPRRTTVRQFFERGNEPRARAA